MKEYKKPSMMTLSLSANDMLCSGCAIKTRKDVMASSIIEDEILKIPGVSGVTPDGFFSEEEANASGTFAAGEACTVEVTVASYCKYSGADNFMLFNS